MKTLWETLSEQKLLVGSEPTTVEASSPWYVKILLAFSGWLAAIFILGFFGTVFRGLFSNEIALILLGIVIIFIAYTVLKKKPNDFIEHLSIAVSFTGQVMIAVALLQLMDNTNVFFWCLILLMQSVLLYFVPNYIHRLFSTFFATYAFSYILVLLGMPHIYVPIMMSLLLYVWINEFSIPHKIKQMQAIGYGLVLALIQIKSMMVFHQSILFWEYSSVYNTRLWFPPLLGFILESVVTLLFVVYLLKKYHSRLSGTLLYISMVSVILFTVLSYHIPGLMVALTVLLLGFYHSNRILLGLGIVTLLAYTSGYYYMLSITLLKKSMWLGLLGVVLLCGRWFVFTVILKDKEVKDAKVI